VVGTILFRMILWELCKVFVIALVGITGILLLAGIIAEASQQGLGPTQILAAIPLLIPSTLRTPSPPPPCSPPASSTAAWPPTTRCWRSSRRG